MRTILNHRPMFFSQECPVHGKCTHEILFQGYSATTHEITCTVTCLSCYEDAKDGDGTFPYSIFHLYPMEWMKIVTELKGESLSDN